MKTHVDNVHPCLFAKRKFVLSERAMAMRSKTYHNWQHGKKKVGATSYAIIYFLGSTHLYKNANEAQQRFIENLVLYISL
jgi:hypothetical protein